MWDIVFSIRIPSNYAILLMKYVFTNEYWQQKVMGYKLAARISGGSLIIDGVLFWDFMAEGNY